MGEKENTPRVIYAEYAMVEITDGNMPDKVVNPYTGEGMEISAKVPLPFMSEEEQQFFEKLYELLKIAEDRVVKNNPRLVHLYKNAKKFRTRKKNQHRLARMIVETMIAK